MKVANYLKPQYYASKVYTPVLFMLLAFAWMISCQRPQNTIPPLNEFPEIAVHPREFTDVTNMYLFSRDLFVYDSLVVVVTDARNSGFFGHAWNRFTGEKVGTFASQGRGPKELGMVPAAFKQGEDTLGLFDFSAGKLIVSSLTDWLNGQWLDKAEQIPINNPLQVNQWAGLGQGQWLTNAALPDGRWALYNRQGKLKRVFGQYPAKQDSNVHFQHLSMAYNGQWATNSQANRAVFATTSGLVLSLFENTPMGLKVAHEMVYHLPQFTPRQAGGQFSTPIAGSCPQGAIDISASDDYIYFVYSGETTDNRGMPALYGKQVYIINWQGEAIGRISINTRLAAISVSPGDTQLFLLSYKGKFLIIELPDFRK